MEYYRILNLVREPFSNSPEPDFFYESRHHLDCLQKLEVSLRLRRGLNVVIGQVGAGKTTLSRQLIRKLSGDPAVGTYLILDPHFSTEMEFLSSVAGLFGIEADRKDEPTAWQLRERIKQFLFEKAVEENNLIVLIIDEGQKIPDFALESLREFLNYETNDQKLLQIAIFAQEEFRLNLARNPGFADRINLMYSLGPLDFGGTRAMIRYRMERATERGGDVAVRFTGPALWFIYRKTGGYPRKIVRLCHHLLLAVIIQNTNRVNWRLVGTVSRRADGVQGPPVFVRARVALVAVLVLAAAAVVFSGLQEGRLFPRDGSVLWESRSGGAAQGETGAVVSQVHHSDGAGTVSVGTEETGASFHGAITGPEPQSGGAEVPAETVGRVPGGDARETAGLRTEETAPSPPDVLGTLRIERNLFVCRMLTDFYGVCDSRHREHFSRVNPHIGNLDHVVEGDSVAMPAVPARRPEVYRQGYWIGIARSGNLDDIYDLHRSQALSKTERRILSYWTREDGLRFAVVFRERFPDEHQASRAMEQLPAPVAAGSSLIGGWPDGTLFFGDWQ